MMSIEARPFFTVIVATYNAADTFDKCMLSLLQQTEKPQIIVADGLSADGTADCARRYQADGVELICERDQGVYDAWNKGLKLARGEWIIFLGADDFYPDHDALRLLRAELVRLPEETELAYGRVSVMNAWGNLIRVENTAWQDCSKRLGFNMPYTHVGSAHSAAVFLRRQFDPTYRIAGDYHFLYPLLSAKDPYFSPAYNVAMLNGGLSTRAQARIQLIQEIKRIRRQYGISVGLIEFFWTEFKLFFYRIRSRGNST